MRGYNGVEYTPVILGRGKAVHFGTPGRNSTITACGKRSQAGSFVTLSEVTCKTCLKMDAIQAASLATLPAEKVEAPAAPAEPAQQLLFTCFECEGKHVGTFAGYSVYGGAALYEVTCERDNLTDRYTLDAFWEPLPETNLGLDLTPPAPVEPEPTQTFEVTYIAPRTRITRTETVQAASVHAVPVKPRDAEVLLSIYLVSKESALLDLVIAAQDSRAKYEATKTPGTNIEHAARHDAYRLATRHEVNVRRRARSLGASHAETAAATLEGIRQVSPDY